MHYRTPLSNVRGLGSAKNGTAHWWFQRVSAVALIPLVFWMLAFINLCAHASFQETLLWLKSPMNSVAMLAGIIAAFYHAALGLQVVVEDYVHNEAVKILSIWAIKLACMGLTLLATIAIFRVISTD
jgi:succinate dehydrogenase / fumarate reductase, membrane anchor subunit